ncbi:hypothetical protein L873DRAFT_1843071 [Choiromyces venosus 120613-1]|uniref:Uncharacterized protein n=1 Tax=Choiromyces venosus 120613-1 TaxID=1336337 RepID=A0A3N4JVW4_9PEZI|nr:hypothetical protein L873DRAFT_1843071 [Choiromyces venosus 120613-1]
MASVCPSYNTAGFMPQPPVLHAREEPKRIEKNNSVFAWIDAVVTSAVDMLETMSTKSPVTNHLMDLFTTTLPAARSSPNFLPLALPHQPLTHNSSGISIVDLDCNYSGPPVSPNLKHTTITSSLNSTGTGDLLLMDSYYDVMDSTCGGDTNPSFPCFIESPRSHNLALSGTLTTAMPLT